MARTARIRIAEAWRVKLRLAKEPASGRSIRDAELRLHRGFGPDDRPPEPRRADAAEVVLTPSDDIPRGLNCLRTPAREHGFEPLRPSFGLVPKELTGTLHRVGPGRFEDADGAYGHWFDGEGLLVAIRLGGGEASAACRLIRPAGSDRDDYRLRGRMGRAPRGLARRLAVYLRPDVYVNVGNTALMHWQGRLFALFEAGLPTEVDPETLETLGETDLGVVRRVLAAHPQPRPAASELIGQGFSPPPGASLDLYAFPAEGAPRRLPRVRVSDRFPAHDFAVTENHAITVLSPLYVDVPKLMAGSPISRCLRWRPQRGSEVVVVPLDGGAPLRLSAPPMLYSHTADAFEDGRRLVVRGVAAEDATLADWALRVRRGCPSLAPAPSPGRLIELRIDLDARETRVRTLFDAPLEFPAVDPRRLGAPARVIYAAGYRDDARAYRDFHDAILRLDLGQNVLTRFDFGPGHVVSEPVFVPSGRDEGEGWLLCVNYDPHRDVSYVAVLSVGTEMRLACTLPLPQPLPMSLHGLWIDGGGRHQVFDGTVHGFAAIQTGAPSNRAGRSQTAFVAAFADVALIGAGRARPGGRSWT